MKILRRILFLILCITLILLLIGFILPAKVHVERSLVINTLPGNIFEKVNSIRNWEKWSPWLQVDTSMQINYSGPDSGVGAAYNWAGNKENIGNGSVTITNSYPNDSIFVIIDYGDKGKSSGKFYFRKEIHGTKVTWCVESDLGINPLSRWFGLFMDKMVGPDLENGLSNLNELTNDLKAEYGFDIIDYEFPAQVLLSIRDTASPGSLNQKITGMFGKISGFMKLKNLPPTGPPLVIYHSYSQHDFDIETCIPIASVIKTRESIICRETSIQKTAMVKYFGTYSSITSAYNALRLYIKNNELQVTGPPWEEYVNDPRLESDSTKWQTNIYYPVK